MPQTSKLDIRGTLIQPVISSQFAGYHIVYYSSVDWNSNWQRPQQFATRLSQLGKMLYINPLGTRSVRPKDLARLWNRLRARKSVPAGSGLTIHNPFLFLPFIGSDTANYINGKVLHQVHRGWMDHFGINDPVIWIGAPSPAALEAVKNIPGRALVYDCMDNFPLFHRGDKRVARIERELASRASIVLATSKALYKRMKEINPNTFLVPNGADFNHFFSAKEPMDPPPQDINDLCGPVLGYYGEIASWFDFDLVEQLASEHMDWNVVLIGRVHTRKDHRLFHLPNVHFLGAKPYEELPRYLSRFDACLLPFKMNRLTESANPVKLYEYLAAGKPVISTPLPEVMPFRDVVEIAESDQFSKAARVALENARDTLKSAQRQQIARQNTWEMRIDEVMRIFALKFSVTS